MSRLLTVLLGIIALSASAQERSNRGKEFWLGYGYNYGFNNEPPVNGQELVLYLSAQEPANVTVSVNGTGWSQTVSIPANTVNVAVSVPKSGAGDARIFTEGLTSRGVHIVSDTPIVVYAHLYNAMVSGATMLMPVETYGYKYYSLNYAQNRSAFSPPTATATITQNGPDWYSWFYVVASEDNTRIEVTPSDSTRGGWLPGQTYTVNLQKGQIYTVMGKLTAGNNALWAASKDMTGSRVLSVPGADGRCHPIAMFSGSSGIRLCSGDGGEYMQQQIFPTQAWGTRYLTYHTLNNTTTNINDPFKNFYRIAVMDPATVVRRNGAVMTGLINNFYYEYTDSAGGDLIEADKPILLAQYTPGGNRCYNMSQFAYGDPEMFYLSAMEQGKKDVLFYATRNRSIDYNYLNVIVPTAGLASLRLDGAPFNPANIITHPNHPGYSVAVARIPGSAAQHRVTSDSAFVGTMYGLGYFESYGYNIGTFINNLNYYTGIRNVYNSSGAVDSFTCPKTPVRFFLKVGYPASSITWRLSQVPGLLPNADSIVANPVPVGTETINGRTYYVYSLQQDFIFNSTGTFIIPVSYTSSVIDNCSQTEYAEIRVVVRPGPVSDFTVNGGPCVSDSLRFTGTPSAAGFNLNAYEWRFDDNTIQTTANAVKRFAASGVQNVRYRVFADNGCAGDTTKTVTLLPTPRSAFGVSGVYCSGDSVLISDSSTVSAGSITSWQWNFGDNTSITRNSGAPFYHRYTTPGTYTITLVTRSAANCPGDTARRTVVIRPRPVANFTYASNLCLGDSIRFTDNSSFTGGTITGWNWNLGDATQLSLTNNQPFSHLYAAPGNYVAALVALGSNGCASDTFRTTVTRNPATTLSFTISGRPCVDSLIIFTSSHPFSAGNPASYYWSFGNGQSATVTTGNSVSFSYGSPAATLVVKHVVIYAPGCASDTVTATIPVIAANPAAFFSISADTVCTGTPVQFTSAINAAGLTWNWNFGNGAGNTAPPFTRSYLAAGSYTISLFTSNAQGCRSALRSQSLVVRTQPVVNAGPDKILAPGVSATLDATSNTTGLSYLWTPSIFLSNPQVLNPTVTPDTTTRYLLVATDPLTGCSSRDSVLVSVFTQVFVPSAFTPNGDGLNDTWQIPGLALYPDALVSVYNRWGQLVYSTRNYTSRPWNGMLGGKMQPNGSYIYYIQLSAKKGELLKGTISLIR